MDINELEREVNFIADNYHNINLYLHFPIETYSKDYNDIFDFWENNKKNTQNHYQFLNKKIKTLESLKKLENNFINSINNLSKKLNNKKISKWKNNFLKIITFGFWDWNKKIETKITILTKIKEIKQQNLVKINELILRINKKNIIKNVNSEINFSVTNKSKSNLSQI
ncbi:hypothetical protein [Spiroplasma ixodetis]|uniref:hypothetical protein n=1 Tax=Spiroplasma ixodetis TaxID=2141 RepID=UPI0025752932|nr:hypothetical protein [Spiroplasma ixodetis]WJG70677.1 hypothetical protein SIXOD_v1c18860 [Spiroplasma ixodetis Y32]